MLSLLLICFAALAAGTPAGAVTEFRLGGSDGNPWEASLSLEGAGDYVVTDQAGVILQRLPVDTTPHGAGTDTLIDFSGTSIQPRAIDPSVNMVLVDPGNEGRQNVLLGYTGGRANITRLGPCTNQANENEIIRDMLDGNPATAMFRGFTQEPGRSPGVGSGWASVNRPRSLVIDLGAAVPVNRIRFYPRLGRLEDRLRIDEFSDPRPPLEAFGMDSFAENFLAWYELRVGDNTPVFRTGPCDAVGIIHGLPWVRPSDSQLEVLADNRESQQVVVDLRFPTRSVRWLNLRPFPVRNWEIAELEVYGEGFVEETVLLTQILDFGQTINWGKLRWRGDFPEGTRAEIRTRTGQSADPNLYFAENTNGETRPITQTEYNRIDVSGRLAPVYDTDNWSFWSPPYDITSGLRDESQPAPAWRDGTPMLSPGPSRYLQIEIRLFATFTAAPRLDQLSVQFATEPSAQEVVGEIWPTQVESFQPTTFTYVVRPVFQPGDVGFDRLEVFTASRVVSIRSVKVDGEEIDFDAFPAEILDDRLVVGFPRLAGEEDSFKQVEVVFEVSVLSFGTEFLGWVFNSENADRIKQRVEPGNATFRFSGNALAVQTPLGGDLLLQVMADPNPFTPNGDGVNEMVTFTHKLRQVTTARAVSVRIYDLAGGLVHELPTIRATSGEFRHHWDGKDGTGRLVAPGIYLYALTLEAADKETHISTFAVVY